MAVASLQLTADPNICPGKKKKKKKEASSRFMHSLHLTFIDIPLVLTATAHQVMFQVSLSTEETADRKAVITGRLPLLATILWRLVLDWRP